MTNFTSFFLSEVTVNLHHPLYAVKLAMLGLVDTYFYSDFNVVAYFFKAFTEFFFFYLLTQLL